MTTPFPSPILGIQAYGAVTNLGNSALQTAASWVAQTRRHHRVKLEGYADPFTLADHADLTDGLQGAERLLTLLKSAVAEAFDNQVAPDDANSLNLLVLPEALETAGQQQLASQLAQFWPDQNVSFSVISGNATAAWSALDSAYRVLEANPRIERVVMVCVDSLCDPERLYQAAEANHLLLKGNSEGYIPSEAAVCLILQRFKDVTQLPPGQFALHRPVLAAQAEPWWPTESKSDPQPLITALSGALDRSDMKPTNISHLQSDMDGSSWRALIEAEALNQTFIAKNGQLPHSQPANLFGHTGVVTGPLGWILGIMVHTQRIKQLNTLLNWSIDPAGQSAACVMERSPKRARQGM
jgi:3-oxoacyl-[acyl-carrier-protein] synthase-1